MTPRTTDNGDHSCSGCASSVPRAHAREVTVELCSHGWARVVVCLPLAEDVPRTMLDAADALGLMVLSGLEVDTQVDGSGHRRGAHAPGAVAVGLEDTLASLN